MGFALTPDEAQVLISKDDHTRDVLFPYVNGEDLNSRPDQSPSRWVINFQDWPLDRSAERSWAKALDDERKAWLRSGRVPADFPGPVAADYPDALAIVQSRVKPERDLVKRDAYRLRWWNYAERQKSLYGGLIGLSRVFATAQTSKYTTVSIQPTSLVFSNAVIVILLEDSLSLSVLTSTIHAVWVWEYVSSLETRLRYVPTDCLETFPFPLVSNLDFGVGERYHELRSRLMLKRKDGLTKIYNCFHDPAEKWPDIVGLRELHREMDQAVAVAYGWTDLDFGHGFHETKQGIRYTISDSARRTVLDRLLRLNHERYEQEVRAGLHDKKNLKPGSSSKHRSKLKDISPDPDDSLFE
jgi:hypothetical protein